MLVQDPALFVYDEAESLEETIRVAMAHHFIKGADLKKFRSKGDKAVSNEITQLHTMITY